MRVHEKRKIVPMYVPSHFAPDDNAVHELLSHHGAADLVTSGPDGLEATMLPLSYDREHGVLRGPDAYVSPSWYASKAEHGRVVPTWNYMIAHVHGVVTIHDDPDWVSTLVRGLTVEH